MVALALKPGERGSDRIPDNRRSRRDERTDSSQDNSFLLSKNITLKMFFNDMNSRFCDLTNQTNLILHKFSAPSMISPSANTHVWPSTTIGQNGNQTDNACCPPERKVKRRQRRLSQLQTNHAMTASNAQGKSDRSSAIAAISTNKLTALLFTSDLLSSVMYCQRGISGKALSRLDHNLSGLIQLSGTTLWVTLWVEPLNR